MDTDRVLKSFGFTVLSSIGEGSFGKVKLAKSKRHPNKVAIKIMDPTKEEDSEFASKYLPREIAILKRVRHLHIIQVHEIYQMPNKQAFIVMEPAIMDLSEKVQELGFIPMDQAKKWLSQLLSAMIYLHQQDIAHRDLKCENVLLMADNQVKLTDFGFGCFSRGFPDLTDTTCGTLCYTAPEVLVGDRYDPKKSDVWSLGVMLFVMVTGELPFDDNSYHSLIRAQKEPCKYPDSIAVEEPCRAIITYMLDYNPLTRPSMTEVAHHPWVQARRDSFRLALRNSQKKKKMRKMFRGNSVVHGDSSSAQQGMCHSAASTEAPACSGFEQRCEDVTTDVLLGGQLVETEAVEAQPTVRQERFSMFKIDKLKCNCKVRWVRWVIWRSAWRTEPGGQSLEKQAWKREPERDSLKEGAWRRVPGGACLENQAWRSMLGESSLEKQAWRNKTGGMCMEERARRNIPGGTSLEKRTCKRQLEGACLEERAWRSKSGGVCLEECASKIEPGEASLEEHAWRNMPGGTCLEEQA
ncbi:testis-specific serine/threonine-protein kinase 6-like [Salminus brasiliensis]|uniref:testis-specific serine/threonine-protein kinase 6-like n=1 Tax=Salminus brasiliensis TaxID=930266 RepID=UPI003B835425